MRAFHSFWSKPNRYRNAGKIVIPDYELLTLVLSALKWRRLNGPIRMITDSAGAAYFERAGLAGLWSEPLDTALDSLDGEGFDPALFWAAGKLEALRCMSAPCVMLDTDMVLWTGIDDLVGNDVIVAHREALSPDVYPEPAEAFELAPGYAFPPEWDFSLPAANTAFLYLPSESLLEYYVGSSFAFMRALQSRNVHPTVAMCFAEQRILPMCAQARGVEIRTLLDEHDLDNQSFVTHLWGYKGRLASSPEHRIAYCLGCVLRILSDFPEWESALAGSEQIRRYLEGLRQ